MRHPRVFTIRPGAPFLPTLVDALTSGLLFGSTALLAEAVIYLPTRRAARELAHLLAARNEGRAMLLPRIVPLGETDEAEYDLAAEFGAADARAALAPPIAPLERRLIFARLVQHWAVAVDRALLRLDPEMPFLVPATPADALALAADLERLMDGFTLEDVPWDSLAGAVEAGFSEYFRLTLDFVRIAREAWPKILAERGASDPVRRRNLLMQAEAQRLTKRQPTTPVIAAGSTGSLPSTAELLAAISRLPNGAVVLPGLDMDLDDASFDAIGNAAETDADSVHGHPQAILQRLLSRHLGVARADVTVLGEMSELGQARARFLSEIMRPAATTDAWARLAPQARENLGNQATRAFSVIEAADEREEALAAAVTLRETLERPGATAMLVTPDTGLAARVRIELERWGIIVDESAGLPLSDSAPGILARLAADAASAGFEPLSLLALLNHPLLRLGFSPDEARRAVRAIEIGVLRGPEPGPGLDGLKEALAARRASRSRYDPRPVMRLTAGDWDLAVQCLDRLADAFTGFHPSERMEETDLIRVAEAHWRTLQALMQDETGEIEADEAGAFKALTELFDELAIIEAGTVRGRFADYPAFFLELSRWRMLRPPFMATHRRVTILGLLEARLMNADRVVLGGLDEGIWPPVIRTDAFLNRPMRAAIGLGPPERRIGQTAHDFTQLAAAGDIVVTRALKRGGAPSLPSRFLQRMRAFAGNDVWGEMTARGRVYLALAAHLETRPAAPPLLRPAPRGDPALFPRSLSVTEIETLIRDPYSIFARHLLKLDPLDPVAVAMSPADRGMAIHEILGTFAEEFPSGPLPTGAEERLKAIAEAVLAPVRDISPSLYADWRKRFGRIVEPYLDWENQRRTAGMRIFAERSGALPFALKDGSLFTLRARADRIEIGGDGSAAIVDFKTGGMPGVQEVAIGFAPQLTLEAKMLMEGAFKDCPKTGQTPDILYVGVSGGREPLRERVITPGKKDEWVVPEIVDEHWQRVRAKIERFVAGEEVYRSRPFPKYARVYTPYDHLARVREWSLSGEGGEE